MRASKVKCICNVVASHCHEAINGNVFDAPNFVRMSLRSGFVSCRAAAQKPLYCRMPKNSWAYAAVVLGHSCGSAYASNAGLVSYSAINVYMHLKSTHHVKYMSCPFQKVACHLSDQDWGKRW